MYNVQVLLKKESTDLGLGWFTAFLKEAWTINYSSVELL